MDRRAFIKTTLVTGAAAAAASRARAGEAPRYPREKLATLDELAPGAAKRVLYPDDRSPVLIVATGRAVGGGVGPRRDVVAYSALCTHRGCEVQAKGDRFVCPCHFSAFDPAREGECYQGVATTYLPRVTLELDGDDVIATGVEGLIWGRSDNR